MQFAHEDVGLCLFHSSNKRMQLVYKFILINKILRNHLFSEHMWWNYASCNVKSNRLTSICSHKIIKLPKFACHSHHWNNPIFISCMITEFYVIAWHVWLLTTEGKNIVNLSAISQSCQFYSVAFNV